MVNSMFRAVFLSLIWALAISLLAEDHVLVKQGDLWRVQAWKTNSVEPKAGWTELNYDDSTWQALPASFSTPTSSGPGFPEQTTLSADNIRTFVFRKTFHITDPAFVRWLALRIDYESGFVAYLNGVEIARRGFDASTNPPALGAAAVRHFRGPTELIDLASFIPTLKAGDNVLAVQLHTDGVDYAGVMMATELLANFTRGPFIQNTTTNSTQIIWHTVVPTTGFVFFGKDADHLSIVSDPTVDRIHAPTLTGLEPGQTYIYRVYAQSGSQVAVADQGQFRTLKMPGSPFTFQVIGDTGQGLTPQFKLAEQMKAHPADLLVHVGDIVYPYFSDLHADARLFSIYRDEMRSTPFFFCVGNHDEYGGIADFYSDFYLPTNSLGTEKYYSFDHADAHFVILATAADNGEKYDPSSPQYAWLQNDLAATHQRWKFIFFHNVMRSSSFHSRFDYYVGDGILDKYHLQTFIGGLAARYGAQIIFNGHDHAYERFAAVDGVNSFVSGGGGATLYAQEFIEDGSAQFHFRNHFLQVTVNGSELTVDAIDPDGKVFDHLYRSEAASGAQPFAAGWGSPLVESGPGTDLAGNIPAQTFNFAGQSMATKAGLRANLGRIHVRNDRTFLYLGFEDAMVWQDQAIALFLENPNQPGVNDLAPLGDNQIDATSGGQGADGLDLLTNLKFRNFRPSIGCLFGDEMADTTIRNFKRANIRWATGQGVFRLDQNFSTVTGARMQQFDRSPQTPVPSLFNENADFIEVAIPLSELGNPRDNLKLGAIVFGDPGTGAMTPVIDTAFAGVALDSAQDGSVTLEPVVIHLAPDPDPFSDGLGFRGSMITSTKLRFEWNSVPGATYTIQATSALGVAFADINAPGLPILATGAITTFDLTIDSTSPRFYRLRAP
jgi:hypothetical protein